MRGFRIASCCVVPFFCIGCRIHPGTNHLLLVTKANSGLDMDTLPATVELSAFGRFDGVHGPTFENAQALPVVTAFQRGEGSVESWPYTGALFAAGPAAMAVALGDGKAEDDAAPAKVGNGKADSQGGTGGAEADVRRENDKYEDMAQQRIRQAEYLEGTARIDLSQPPRVDSADKRLFVPGETPPIWFGTAEVTGVEYEMYGPSFLPLPQSFHIGFRRKEFLISPIHMNRPDGAQGNDTRVEVKTPSVLAMVNVVGKDDRGLPRAGNGDKGKARQEAPRRIQLFATGKAATLLASKGKVHGAFLQGMTDDSPPKPEALPPTTDVTKKEPCKSKPAVCKLMGLFRCLWFGAHQCDCGRCAVKCEPAPGGAH